MRLRWGNDATVVARGNFKPLEATKKPFRCNKAATLDISLSPQGDKRSARGNAHLERPKISGSPEKIS
ncbi:hypothetical protein HT136_00505 [Novosphingobium profundi]|uniref:hypothetical protein n=1 Tax=Novosphingobium profundi TaxID=1774954 RepID=UPI001BD925E8|nr:hypothetical protein [Novosphingobium profundi]MBT0666848.1 hypothetical protein [Novosphingobium profundi]